VPQLENRGRKTATGNLRLLDQRGAFGGRSVFRPIVLAMTIAKMLTAMIHEIKERDGKL
jgi:hypothetical protein